MSIYAYVYSYREGEIQGKGMDVGEYLSLSASPGIYFTFCTLFNYKGEWSVLEVTRYGTYNTLPREEVPNEVKIHHLLTT